LKLYFYFQISLVFNLPEGFVFTDSCVINVLLMLINDSIFLVSTGGGEVLNTIIFIIHWSLIKYNHRLYVINTHIGCAQIINQKNSLFVRYK